MKLSIKQGALFALILSIAFAVFASVSNYRITAQSPARAKSGSDWADWRGPTRDGHSYETGLPRKRSAQGENLLWKGPSRGGAARIGMEGRGVCFKSAGARASRGGRG